MGNFHKPSFTDRRAVVCIRWVWCLFDDIARTSDFKLQAVNRGQALQGKSMSVTRCSANSALNSCFVISRRCWVNVTCGFLFTIKQASPDHFTEYLSPISLHSPPWSLSALLVSTPTWWLGGLTRARSSCGIIAVIGGRLSSGRPCLRLHIRYVQFSSHPSQLSKPCRRA